MNHLLSTCILFIICSCISEKIIKLETFTQQDIFLCRLTTENGFVGFGQGAHFSGGPISGKTYANLTALIFQELIAPVALGKDVDNVPLLSTNVVYGSYRMEGDLFFRALAALDLAAWEVVAKMQNKSVVQVLGGTMQPIRAYASSMSRKKSADDLAKQFKKEQEEKGFTAFKLKIANAMGNNTDSWVNRSNEVIATTRKKLGPNVQLMADANGGYTDSQHWQPISKLLHENNYTWFEEPVPFWDYVNTKRVRDQNLLKVAAGEQEYRLDVWETTLRDHAIDIAQPDMMYGGGLSRALEVSRIAAKYGQPVIPHAPCNSLNRVVVMHYLNAIPNSGKLIEWNIDNDPYVDLYTPKLKVINGHAVLPGGNKTTGWGITFNQEWLDSAFYWISKIYHQK